MARLGVSPFAINRILRAPFTTLEENKQLLVVCKTGKRAKLPATKNDSFIV